MTSYGRPNGVPNHRQLDCLLKSLHMITTKTSKLHITGLYDSVSWFILLTWVKWGLLYTFLLVGAKPLSFIQENAFKNVACEMVAILSRPQSFKYCMPYWRHSVSIKCCSQCYERNIDLVHNIPKSHPGNETGVWCTNFYSEMFNFNLWQTLSMGWSTWAWKSSGHATSLFRI